MKYYIDCYSRLESMCHRITMKSSFAPNVVQLFRNKLKLFYIFNMHAMLYILCKSHRKKNSFFNGGDSKKHNSVKYVAWHGTLCDDELCQT